MREFTDADGATWQVWAVNPAPPDRRSGRDRRAHPASDPWHERRGPDRRVRQMGRPAAIAGPLAEGWLCFEAAAPDGRTLRRRLTPIPPDWEECAPGALRASLARAIPVVPRHRSA